MCAFKCYMCFSVLLQNFIICGIILNTMCILTHLTRLCVLTHRFVCVCVYNGIFLLSVLTVECICIYSVCVHVVRCPSFLLCMQVCVDAGEVLVHMNVREQCRQTGLAMAVSVCFVSKMLTTYQRDFLRVCVTCVSQ